MSQPYQFSDPDRVTSPFDRKQPTTIDPAEAPSFKTNVNRNKTKKWVDAKAISYGGDDWDDYDPDNEYGVDAPPPLPVPGASKPVAGSAGRNFTGPATQTHQRTSSFERGDEKRTFSAGNNPPPLASPPAAITGPPTSQKGDRAVSGVSVTTDASAASSSIPEHRRDFSPSAMPPPLQTRGQSGSPAPSLTSPIQRPPSAGAYDPRATSPAAIPFIRPADIYKRMEEAKEAERRSSMDSNQSTKAATEDPSRSHPGQATVLDNKTSSDRLHDENIRLGKTPLANIPERKSEYGMLDQPGAKEKLKTIGQPRPDSGEKYQLPSLGPGPDFENDFWGSSPAAGISETKPVVVDTKPLPPISTATAIGSTLSPTDNAPSRESSKGFRTMVSKAFQPAAGVSKQDSMRSQTTDYSQGTSDISPILSPIPDQPETQPVTPKASETKNLPPTPNLLAEAKNKPLPMPGDPEKASPITTKDDELPQPPKLGSTPNSRSASPSKNRVRDLATQFNDWSESRRSSVVSVGSKQGAAEVKIAESPRPQSAEILKTKDSAFAKPPEPIEDKPLPVPTRPKIPGQFDSYALANSDSELPTPSKEFIPPLNFGSPGSKPLPPNKVDSEPDLSPTTTRHNLESKDVSKSLGAMAGLAAAGAALGEAFRRNVGDNDKATAPESKSRQFGDVPANRPGPLERFESTATESTIPPTPPAKDFSSEDDILPPLPLKTKTAPTSTPEKPLPRPVDVDSTPKASDATPKSGGDQLALISTASSAEPSAPKNNYEVSPISPDSAPKIGRKFSWETQTSLAPSTTIEATSPPLSARLAAHTAQTNISSSNLAPARADTVVDNSRVSGEGLHVINAQPGELPKAATDPTLNAPSQDVNPIPVESALASEHLPVAAPNVVGKGPEPAPSSSGPSTAAVIGGGLAAGAVGAGLVALTNKGERDSPPPPAKDALRGNSVTSTTTALPSQVHAELTAQRPQSQGTTNLMSFREIMAIKSTPDRIATYNSTRTTWSTMDPGLNQWLSQTLQKYPEHTSLKAEAAQPFVGSSLLSATTSSPIGRSHTKGASISKMFGASSMDVSGSHGEYSPEGREKRSSGPAAMAGAGKAMGETLKGLGGKGKGLLERINRGRKKGDDVGN